MYYDPDLTAEDFNCLSENNRYTLHTPNQKIEFDIPVYLSSININILGPVPTPMVRGIDWVAFEDDMDNTSISKMKSYDSSFDKILVKSITIIKTLTVSALEINISYQQLYPVAVKQALFYGNRLEFNPDLLANMITDINYLKHITRDIEDSLATTYKSPKLFPEDRNKNIASNMVIDELHTINTIEGRKYIKPLGGSFYNGEEFNIRMVDNPDPLVYGEDYIFLGFNVSKTRTTSSTSAIYDYVVILRDYVGDIKIDYHAFGGDPSVEDVRVIDSKLNDVIDFLKSSSFLTDTTLSASSLIQNILEKITTLENEMRILNQNQPVYGDVSTGSSSIHKLVANDNDIHWYNVASLYTIDNDLVPIINDRMFLRISTLYTKFMFDIMVNVNLHNKIEPLTLSVVSENYPKGYDPLEGYDIGNIIRPRMRIIWNENDENNSGIFLQLGFELKGIIEERIGIQDMSGKESCWKLLPSSEEPVVPQDDMVQLPNENHIYSVDNPDSRSSESLIPFKDGYLIYAGAIPLNRPEGGFKENFISHYLSHDTDITKVYKCRLELSDENCVFPLDINFTTNDEVKTGIINFMYNGEDAYVICEFFRDMDDDEIKMKIISSVDINTTASILNIRHILIYT
jgi:hypothetical protein